MFSIKKMIYPMLVGAGIGCPLLVQAVTLPYAPRTPCHFGAMGDEVICSDLVHAPSMPRATIGTAASASEVILEPLPAYSSQAQSFGSANAANVSAVPLPVAGVLLLGSLGLMLLTQRRRPPAGEDS